MIKDGFWPTPDAFLDISLANQMSDGAASCSAVAVCDEDGRPTRRFYQGQQAHVFYEFKIHGDIDVPAGGLQFCDARGWIVHGKNGFQYDMQLPSKAAARDQFRRVVQANRFEQLASRPRGQEDVTAHTRKGIANDWQNHFTDRLKKAFKARYGGLLIATGYEPNLEW